MKSMSPVYGKLVSGVIAVAALGIIYGSLKMPMGTLLTPAAGLAPLLLGCATFALACLAIFRREAVKAESALGGAEEKGKDLPQEASVASRPLAIMIVLGLVIFGFERAGFILTLLGGTFLLLHVIEKRPLAQSLIIAALLSGGLYLLFTKLLFVGLPNGWLEF